MGSVKKVRTSDGVDIAFQISGFGDPIVFLHGITENRTSWNTIAEILSADYQFICVDLRGHGESGRGSDYHPRTLAADVQCVMREIGIDPVAANLVGHSLGGATATFVASRFGARSVTNIDQPMNLDALIPLLHPIESALRGPDFGETLQSVLSGLEGDRLPSAVRRELLVYHQDAEKNVVLGCWDLILGQPPQSIATMVDMMFETVKVPYWSLHGTDPGTQYEAWLKKRLPTAILEVWPGFGHWLHRVDPERFVGRLREFLHPGSSPISSEKNLF